MEKDKLEALDAKEKALAERMAKLEAMEEEIRRKEKAMKQQEKAKKQIILRITPSLWEEIAQWAYFLTVTNTFCTGQSIIIDGGESIKHNFVWKES